MILIFFSFFIIFSDYGRYYYPNYGSDTNRPKRQKNATDYFYDYDLTSSDSTDSDDPLFISYNVTFSEETEDLPFKSQDYSSFISEVDTETSANNYPSNNIRDIHILRDLVFENFDPLSQVSTHDMSYYWTPPHTHTYTLKEAKPDSTEYVLLLKNPQFLSNYHEMKNTCVPHFSKVSS